MKTIRRQTFETNSSSTHACTIIVPSDKITLRSKFACEPGQVIEVQLGPHEEGTPISNIGLLLHFLKLDGDTTRFETLVSTIEIYNDIKLFPFVSSYDFNAKAHIKTPVEDLKPFKQTDGDDRWDETGYFAKEDYQDWSETIDCVRKIVDSPERTIEWVFGSGSKIGNETYYDG